MTEIKISIKKKGLFLILCCVLTLVNNISAQEISRGISYAVGIGFVGTDKMKGIGPLLSAFFPLSENSELKADLSYNSIPSELSGYDNLKITCLETDYRYVFEPGPAFMQVGLGLNVNMLNGGYSHQEISGSTRFEPYKNAIGLGFGLNIGIGFYVAEKFAVFGDFAAQGIFGKAETGWGGIKVGLRYFPLRKKEIITRDWLNK
jgi:hypothetical protein